MHTLTKTLTEYTMVIGVSNQSLETQITMVKCTKAGERTKGANDEIYFSCPCTNMAEIT